MPRAWIQVRCRPSGSTRTRPSRPRLKLSRQFTGRPLGRPFLLSADSGRQASRYTAKRFQGGDMVRLATICVALMAAAVGTAQAQTDLVKRGDYLVNTIMTCGNCHMPK